MKHIVSFGLAISLFLVFTSCFAQETVKLQKTINVGCGLGITTMKNANGGGTLFLVGFSKEVFSDKLLIKPEFGIGHFSSKQILDARDQYFVSINASIGLYYSLIKCKSAAFQLGCGGLINNSKGLIGTGGDPELYTDPPESEYFNHFHVGAFCGSSVKIVLKENKSTLNFRPFNVHFGSNMFGQFFSIIEIDFNLQ